MKMHPCKSCGYPTRSNFELCFQCFRREKEAEERRHYLEMSEDEKELEREIYYSTECDMCGKEGASPRADGRNYCGTCWTVWNS
jgi:hypothetical protein